MPVSLSECQSMCFTTAASCDYCKECSSVCARSLPGMCPIYLGTLLGFMRWTLCEILPCMRSFVESWHSCADRIGDPQGPLFLHKSLHISGHTHNKSIFLNAKSWVSISVHRPPVCVIEVRVLKHWHVRQRGYGSDGHITSPQKPFAWPKPMSADERL